MLLHIDTKDVRYLAGKAKRKTFVTHMAGMQYCRENKVGAKAALATGNFPGINYQSSERRLKGKIKKGCEDESRSLLLL